MVVSRDSLESFDVFMKHHIVRRMRNTDLCTLASEHSRSIKGESESADKAALVVGEKVDAGIFGTELFLPGLHHERVVHGNDTAGFFLFPFFERVQPWFTCSLSRNLLDLFDTLDLEVSRLLDVARSLIAARRREG
jgi:hypothetical protein